MKTVRGFSLVEVLVVLLLFAVMLGFAAETFNGYLKRTTARRAAEIFVQDLNVTRNAALRSRRMAVLAFDETGLNYLIRMESGDTVLLRAFGKGAEIALSALDLEVSGDTLVFDSRGQADLTGAVGPLGRAVFSAGSRSYAVSFNSMGVSRIDGP
ncbi:MAG: prepilin-type N-terminal cleavage/methylation domain-containing protein [Gemmatimonadota bacterium]